LGLLWLQSPWASAVTGQNKWPASGVKYSRSQQSSLHLPGFYLFSCLSFFLFQIRLSI
jgi:hypothetical protein